MTDPTPHRATPSQWRDVKHYASQINSSSALHGSAAVILELADRLQAAERRLSELKGSRRAMLNSSAPVVGPPQVTSALLRDADESEHEWAERLLKAGWDAAMATTANLRQQDEDAERAMEPAPAGSLVEAVADLSPAARAVMDAMRAISPAPADELAAAALRALADFQTVGRSFDGPLNYWWPDDRTRRMLRNLAEELESTTGTH